MRILEQNLAQAAQLSASEEVSMITASREILTSLAAQPDVRAGTGAACRRALQRAIGGLEQYEGAAVVNAEGVLTCTTAPSRKLIKLDDRAWFRDILRGESFVISDLLVSRWIGNWGIITAVPLVDEQGVIHGSVALFIGLDWLAQRYRRIGETPDVAFALLDSRGEIISGETERSPRSNASCARSWAVMGAADRNRSGPRHVSRPDAMLPVHTSHREIQSYNADLLCRRGT